MHLLLCLCGLVVLAPALVHAAVLEIPGSGAKLSGIGVISGWKCEASGPLTVRFNDGDPIPLPYGSERSDTAGVCGDTDNGFGTIWNWAHLGDGTHTAVAYDGEIEFARSTFEVATTGEEFVRGASAGVRVLDFPSPGESVRFEWNQSTQHLEMVLGPEGEELIDSLAMEFVRIETGTFQMGSPAEAEDHEEDETLHQVTISQPFYLGKYEVTQAQWRAVMGDNPSFFRHCGDSCPVEGVSWEEVETFIAELNARTGETTYRLPTEAEWEYAARAGTQTTYHFGEAESELCRYANHADSSTGLRWRNTTCSDGVAGGPAPVGSYQPNQWGLYDMHGNVWEWVADWYGEYPTGPVTDPQGPATGNSRVGRGGGWRSTAPSCRVVNRFRYEPSDRNISLGFRLARTIP